MVHSTTAPRRLRSVLLVTHYYAPEHGAPQRRWSALVEEFVRAGVRVTVLAPPPHYPTGTPEPGAAVPRAGSRTTGPHGETVVRTAFRRHDARLRTRVLDQAVAAWSSVLLGLRLHRQGMRHDVVIGTVPGIPSMFAAWALARSARARFVVEMRDAWPDLLGPSKVLAGTGTRRTGLRGTVTHLVHLAVTRMQRRADLLVTTTETFAGVAAARGARRTVVVRNGTAYRTVGRAASDQPGRALRVVYAGTVGRAQGLDAVVRASARLAREGTAIEVRIVGAGADVDRLGRLATELDAPVSLEPRLAAQDVAGLYAWADTALVCLRDWEPLEWTVPSKLYELMAAGVHVTACVAGEAADLVTAVGAGAVVPPGDDRALAALWAAWTADGVRVPVVSPAAAAWVDAHVRDDQLAARYLRTLDELLA
ncbi:glycosyltransferase involved in cell wall biosynthesis [Sediminihabitans luteus]|uniref:D-inositol 3-phosphate glycosyltransferase n=1 Tax=Sediminihabitans luteus TaxID=1138585 RepID=A0A2M9CE26_9CELL|nr:glycosyltransferase family 4 protein [Sediminihabitans luteus]PJJ70153.1 glycosyltransferase involved in cell wall biosynthesis [Sediminihabitans luteus]GII97624.1 glycosyltransferase WbuB [Sediminihabitans luteus]